MALLSSLASPGLGLGSGADPTLPTGTLSAMLPSRVPPPSFFGKGGTGRTIAGYVGDALLQLGGQKPVYSQYMAQAPERELRDLILRTQLAKASQPERQVVNLGDGGVGEWSPTGGLSILREPAPAPPKPSGLEQGISLYRQFNPSATPEQLARIVERGIAGYGYSPEAQQQKIDTASSIAAAQGAQARMTKSTPSARSAGGGAAAKLPSGFILD